MTWWSSLTVILAANSVFAESPWWKNGVLYQVYPRSFADSNGDGEGDIRGITQNVRYLADIGVNIVWLNPVYESPWQDNGYDISNFNEVHHTFGTLEDLKNLIKEVHNLGMKFLLDFVPNHTSDQHPWFKASKDGVGEEKDFYIWKDPKGFSNDGEPTPPNNWRSEINLNESAWEYYPPRKQFYLHQFGKFQPDLNFSNPMVLEAMKDVMRFWLDLGVDGFRVDAVPFLMEDPEWRDEPIRQGCDFEAVGRRCLNQEYTENLPGTYEILKDLDEVISKEYNDKFLFIEAYAPLDKTIKYYQNASSPFNFFFIRNVSIDTNATALKGMVDRYLESLPAERRWPNWVMGNHDNPRAGTRFGQDIIDSINMIALLMPGVGVTYQGEEIGMVDTYLRRDQASDPLARDTSRTPMQWNDNINAGFSSAEHTWLPVNPNYWHVNVKSELSDPNSHLNIYKQLTNFRRLFADSTEINTAIHGDWIFGFQRNNEGQTCYVVINLNNVGENLVLSKMFPAAPSCLYVRIASLNSGFSDNEKITTDETIYLRPRSGIVLVP